MAKAAAKIVEGGVLVVHDFFTDTDWRGAVYDLHMMVNTYNGQTYTKKEVATMADGCGFSHCLCRELASGSSVLAFARHQPVLSQFT